MNKIKKLSDEINFKLSFINDNNELVNRLTEIKDIISNITVEELKQYGFYHLTEIYNIERMNQIHNLNLTEEEIDKCYDWFRNMVEKSTDTFIEW